MKKRKVFCVTTGMHRSGTTWLGNAIDSIPDVFSMEEPFNFDHGLKKVPRWYVDYRDPTDVAYTRDALRAIEAGSVHFRHKFEFDEPLTSIRRMLVGNRSEREYRSFLKTDGTLINLKDPFLVMMIPELVNMKIKVIVSVRHPAAIQNSLARMGWNIPNEFLIGRDYGGGFSVKEDGVIVAMASFWKAVYKPLIDQLKCHGSDGVLVAFHETMFDDVLRQGQAILQFLGKNEVVATESFMRFVRGSTNADTVQPGHRRQHDLVRDSKKLAHSWRNQLSTEDCETYDRLIGEDYEYLRDASKRIVDELMSQ